MGWLDGVHWKSRGKDLYVHVGELDTYQIVVSEDQSGKTLAQFEGTVDELVSLLTGESQLHEKVRTLINAWEDDVAREEAFAAIEDYMNRR